MLNATLQDIIRCTQMSNKSRIREGPKTWAEVEIIITDLLS